MQLMIELCALAEYTGSARFSRSHTSSIPLKSPVARLRSASVLWPNVPHLIASVFSFSFTICSSPCAML